MALTDLLVLNKMFKTIIFVRKIMTIFNIDVIYLKGIFIDKLTVSNNPND